MNWNRSGKFEYEIEAQDNGNIRHSFYIDGKHIRLPLDMFGKKLKTSVLLNCNGFGWEYDSSFEDEFAWYSKKIYKKDKIPAKEFIKTYGVSPAVVARVANAAYYKAAIKPYTAYRSLWYTGKKINNNLYSLVVRNWDIIQQAEKDGLKHITPFIAYWEKSPTELRALFGKGVWKKLSSNSYTRNILLAQKMLFSWQGGKILTFDLEVPSTLLRSSVNPDIAHYVFKNSEKSMRDVLKAFKKTTEERKLLDIVRDCKRMKVQLGQPFSLNWSPRRMEEEHNNSSRELQRRREEERAAYDQTYREKLEKAKSKNLADFYKVNKWQEDSISARLLTTYDEIVAEGNTMHHCVGSYALDVMDDEYLVVHVESEEYKSTVGMRKSETYWQIEQQYGICNDYKVPEAHKSMAQKVLKELNDQIKYKK